LNIDIDHIGVRQMTRFTNAAFALAAALMLTMVTFYEVVAVPVAPFIEVA
jgi:hypothetical protein